MESHDIGRSSVFFARDSVVDISNSFFRDIRPIVHQGSHSLPFLGSPRHSFIGQSEKQPGRVCVDYLRAALTRDRTEARRITARHTDHFTAKVHQFFTNKYLRLLMIA